MALATHFNPSTLKASFNAKTKKARVWPCYGSVEVSFSDVIECPPVVCGWPSDLNAENTITCYAYARYNATRCVFLGTSNDWYVSLIKTVDGTDPPSVQQICAYYKCTTGGTEYDWTGFEATADSTNTTRDNDHDAGDCDFERGCWETIVKGRDGTCTWAEA